MELWLYGITSFIDSIQQNLLIPCKIAELISRASLFDGGTIERDAIVEEWINVFGDLPEEWKGYVPPKTDDCEYMVLIIRTSFPLEYILNLQYTGTYAKTSQILRRRRVIYTVHYTLPSINSHPVKPGFLKPAWTSLAILSIP